jgi:predicted nucleic acid-binding protein
VGVFLDTSVPIKAQRMRMTETDMIREITNLVGDTPLGTSTIVVTELMVGIFRGTPQAQQRREEFFAELMRDVPVYPYSQVIAELAGRIGARQSAVGQTVPPIDLMIGATALSLGFSILITNVRHFNLIPGLEVIPF